MADLTRDSDRLVREAGQSLAHQRAGGRRKSIGKASASMKLKHTGKKIRNIIFALIGIIIAASVAGMIVDGIGFTGIMIAFGVAMLSTLILSNYPRLKIPERADLKTDDVRKLVAQTELWLESRRSALPPQAVKIIDRIGSQLDVLGVQLEEVDQQHPTARQIRKLIGVDLPEMIEGYEKIPEKLRYEERGGTTPTAQLVNGLDLISAEIDSVTRQLANGALDDLAIRTRYLDYKYGEGIAEPQLADQSGDSGVPLDFEKSTTKVARD